MWDFAFFFSGIMLGIGLAMDAFSVSLANGLHEPCMKKGRMCAMAGVFGFFQALMPFIGWICVHTVLQYFQSFQKFIPWIALALLGYIGGKMLYEGICNKDEGDCGAKRVGIAGLLVQGIATSIDALSVGLNIAEYDIVHALVCAAMIAAVTFVICVVGIYLGKKFGTGLSNKASILGGGILIAIGLYIFIRGMLEQM